MDLHRRSVLPVGRGPCFHRLGAWPVRRVRVGSAFVVRGVGVQPMRRSPAIGRLLPAAGEGDLCGGFSTDGRRRALHHRGAMVFEQSRGI